ncbi:MAG TPA: SpoVR family protein, partial [Pseudomonas sp.]|nr:SpoVR family protein [Pseudomonas sp.]
DRKPLGDSSGEVVKHLHRLWGFDIHLESMRGDQLVGVQRVPPRNEQGDENEYPRLDLVIPPI